MPSRFGRYSSRSVLRCARDTCGTLKLRHWVRKAAAYARTSRYFTASFTRATTDFGVS
jgi:hypothetical protein